MNFIPEQELKKIISDNISGSSLLLEKLNAYLLDNFKQYHSATLIKYLKNSFREFSNIQNYLSELEKISDKNPNKVGLFLEKKFNEKTNTAERIYRNALQYLNHCKNFITISNSQTIINLFELLSHDNNRISITVCESRPLFEGRIMAEELINFPIKVKLITEAMIVNEMNGIDAAVIGADSLLPNGNIVNKVGSNLLALSCKYFSKPFYVIADKSKIADVNDFNQVIKPSKEICVSKNEKLEINNYYFEVVEKSFITSIITD